MQWLRIVHLVGAGHRGRGLNMFPVKGDPPSRLVGASSVYMAISVHSFLIFSGSVRMKSFHPFLFYSSFWWVGPLL